MRTGLTIENANVQLYSCLLQQEPQRGSSTLHNLEPGVKNMPHMWTGLWSVASTESYDRG